jgi:hypothetical protein
VDAPEAVRLALTPLHIKVLPAIERTGNGLTLIVDAPDAVPGQPESEPIIV